MNNIIYKEQMCIVYVFTLNPNIIHVLDEFSDVNISNERSMMQVNVVCL